MLHTFQLITNSVLVISFTSTKFEICILLAGSIFSSSSCRCEVNWCRYFNLSILLNVVHWSFGWSLTVIGSNQQKKSVEAIFKFVASFLCCAKCCFCANIFIVPNNESNSSTFEKNFPKTRLYCFNSWQFEVSILLLTHL